MKRAFVLILAVVAIIIVIISFVVFIRNPRPVVTDDQPSIVVTFYPLSYIAERIGGDNVTVDTLVPSGVEPHDFTPLPDDIQKIYTADIVIMNGGGIDAWAEDVQGSKTLVISEVLGFTTTSDPHVWIDPTRAQRITEVVRDTFIQHDPKQKSVYEQNARALIADLQALDEAYSRGLKQCSMRTIIASHNAFQYVGERYDFTILSIAGLNPNATPSAKTFAALADTARTQGIRYIFFETLVSPELAQALADEIGAETLVLNPLEGLTPEEQAAREDYLSVMRKNLDNLRTAMECQ